MSPVPSTLDQKKTNLFKTFLASLEIDKIVNNFRGVSGIGDRSRLKIEREIGMNLSDVMRINCFFNSEDAKLK